MWWPSNVGSMGLPDNVAKTRMCVCMCVCVYVCVCVCVCVCVILCVFVCIRELLPDGSKDLFHFWRIYSLYVGG